jgi:hypothetical protein
VSVDEDVQIFPSQSRLEENEIVSQLNSFYNGKTFKHTF